MLKTRDERRAHLRLSDPCLEIGGSGSKEYRGLKAHSRKTTIPTGRSILLCHGCHNPKCSNPDHLYWGTAKDNCLDQAENGTLTSLKTRMIAKYGEVEYSRIVSEAARKARAVSVTVASLSNDELNHIRDVINSVPKGRGRIAKLSILLKVSHTHVRRYIKRLANDHSEPNATERLSSK